MSSHASHRTVEAAVRPVPRFGVFMALGVVLGVIAAGFLTAIGSYEPSTIASVTYPPAQVFGFSLLWTVPVGIALGGAVALVLERVARRHTRVIRVEHERVTDAEA